MSARTYIDTTYMPGIPASGKIPAGAGRKRRSHHQAGGKVHFKDIVHGAEKVINWAKEHQPIGHLDDFLEKTVPIGASANPVYRVIKGVTSAGKAMGFGDTYSPSPPQRRS
jgi:hypothetical protein